MPGTPLERPVMPRVSSSDVLGWVDTGSAVFEPSSVTLGRGGEGVVCLGTVRNRLTGESTPVAAKRLHRKDASPVDEITAQQAANGRRSSASSGVLTVFGAMSSHSSNPNHHSLTSPPAAAAAASSDDTYIVMSLCALTLKQLIDPIAALERTPGWEVVHLKILIDFLSFVVSASRSCEAQKVAHRDIKPDNIALRFDVTTQSYVLVLMDFGGARTQQFVRENHGVVMNLTPYYAAPEQMVVHGVSGVVDRLSTQKIDAYSFGMTFRELLGNPVVYDGIDRANIERLCWGKEELFVRASKETTKAPQQLEDDATTSQMHEIAQWGDSAVLLDCISKVAEWLVEMLPECRPSIDVLEMALNRIRCIFLMRIESEGFDPVDIATWTNEFYEECKRARDAQATTAPAAADTLVTGSTFGDVPTMEQSPAAAAPFFAPPPPMVQLAPTTLFRLPYPAANKNGSPLVDDPGLLFGQSPP